MPNIAHALNDQIRRLANRQINRQGKVTRKLLAQHRRDLAALKRQMSAVLRSLAFLERQEKCRTSAGLVRPIGSATATPGEDGAKGLRFRADGMRTHRAKLGLSAADYGKLVGVSGLTIYHWESRKATPRRSQLPKLAVVRGLGKREALKRLELMK